jgi:hypothetical protein
MKMAQSSVSGISFIVAPSKNICEDLEVQALRVRSHHIDKVYKRSGYMDVKKCKIVAGGQSGRTKASHEISLIARECNRDKIQLRRSEIYWPRT